MVGSHRGERKRTCPHTGRPLDKDPATTIRWTADPDRAEKAGIDCELSPEGIVVWDALRGNPDRWIKASAGSYITANQSR